LAHARLRLRVNELQNDIRALAKTGAWAAVLAADTELAGLDPGAGDPDGLTTKARAELAVEQREAALAADYHHGLRLFDAGRWEEAVAAFERVTRLDSTYQDVASLLGRARRELASATLAEEQARREAEERARREAEEQARREAEAAEVGAGGDMAASRPMAPGRIFISYRRAESAYPTGWLYDRLANHFGRADIVRDIDTIEPGDDFVEVIGRAVASCDVMLVVIGTRWISITDEDGRRRLDHSDDFVRREIEAAWQRDIRVIPILVDGATMPRTEQLPPSLVKLTRHQALELSPYRFDTDRLLRVLDKTVSEEKKKRHSEEQS
jgi:hypothetical protein